MRMHEIERMRLRRGREKPTPEFMAPLSMNGFDPEEKVDGEDRYRTAAARKSEEKVQAKCPKEPERKELREMLNVFGHARRASLFPGGPRVSEKLTERRLSSPQKRQLNEFATFSAYRLHLSQVIVNL
jgi:hypothetical protein